MQKILKICSTLTPTFTHLSCWDYLRNKSRPGERLIEDAQQSCVKRVARRSDPELFDFNVFIVKNLALLTKNILKEKNLKSIINTKIYKNTLEICRDRDKNGSKNIESRLPRISYFVAAEARYYSASSLQNSAIWVLKTHFPENHQDFVQYRQIKKLHLNPCAASWKMKWNFR